MNRKDVLVYTILTLYVCERTLCNSVDMWKTTVVSKASLGAATLKSQSFPCFSDIICAMAASRISFANLLSFKDGICNVFSYLALPGKNSSTISDPEECMTKLNDGCLYNGDYYQFGETVAVAYAPTCRNPVCLQNELTAVPPLNVIPSGSCLLPFKLYNPYGCLYLYSTKMTLCSALSFCQSYGGSLFTFEKNQTSAFISGAFAAILGAGSSDFWIGLYYSGSEYMWIDGVTPANISAGMWDTAYSGITFPPTYDFCVRTSAAGGTYYITALSCSVTRAVVCQQKMLP